MRKDDEPQTDRPEETPQDAPVVAPADPEEDQGITDEDAGLGD